MNYKILAAGIIVVGVLAFTVYPKTASFTQVTNNQASEPNNNDEGGITTPHELAIQTLRDTNYPGSEITIEETLAPGSNYARYRASYTSEGHKIYALLTVPNGQAPQSGWPVVIFNHGYIPPAEYRTTERYIPYTDAFSRNGYIVFKSDYRGHGSSEGPPSGAYGSNGYTIDVLNAVASIKKYDGADPNRIGMWGHSMGGYITLRSMVVSRDIKAGVIWAGVVGSYPDMLNRWRRSSGPTPTSPVPTAIASRRWRQALVEQFGTPEANPSFWNSISANSFLKDISGPLQIHHGTADSSVPVEFSETLDKQMSAAEQTSELFVYPGDDHNLSGNLSIALARSVAFFDTYVKGEKKAP